MSLVTVTKHGRTRFWAVRDGEDDLICVCVYKRGAIEVARRLTSASPLDDCYLREIPPEPGREPERALSKTACQGELAGPVVPGPRHGIPWTFTLSQPGRLLQ